MTGPGVPVSGTLPPASRGSSFPLGPFAGQLFYRTDLNELYYWNGTIWIGTGGAGLHAPTHQDGGADEIDVTGLSGLLADPQVPVGHHLTHEDGGADEIDLTGMSGEEIRLIPKASSTGPEGTIFYSSVDKAVFVARVP